MHLASHEPRQSGTECAAAITSPLAMTKGEAVEHVLLHPPAEAVRRYLTIGFWLMAAGAAAALGLDLDGDILG